MSVVGLARKRTRRCIRLVPFASSAHYPLRRRVFELSGEEENLGEPSAS